MRIDKVRFLKGIVFAGIAIFAGATGYFIISQPRSLPPLASPSDFDLTFRYGVGAKNELDTFSQTYTKDMIIDPPVTTEFKLADSEKAGIYRKINDLRLFEKDGEFMKGGAFVSPCSSYYLKIKTDSVERESFWDDCRGISDRQRQFINYIILSDSNSS